VVHEHPQYMAATDLYSDVLWEQNKPDEALLVLERLGANGVGSVTRLRKLADLAVRVGDDTRAKTYLNKVIDRSRSSSLGQMHDYLQLAKIYTKEGRHEDADKLTSRMKKVVNSADLDFARAIMGIQREIADNRVDKARDKLAQVFDNQTDLIAKLETDAQTSLLEQCFAAGMDKEGFALASTISRRSPGKALLDRIKVSIDASKARKAAQGANPVETERE
ncbi:MAG: hypothetical protein HC848_03335, partial [Limnobacter sp.]|nr:hypothetical protein [Limnobacter sp.]